MASTSDESGLSDFHVAELRKAFACMDRDASGQLSVDEVRAVLTGMVSNGASEDDAARVLALLDTDKSGTVSFDEFVRGISSWLHAADAVASDGGGVAAANNPRKRKSAADDAAAATTREDVHKRVRSFFTQFHTSSAALGAIRSDMMLAHDAARGDFDDLADVLTFSSAAYDSAFKLDFLQKLRVTVGSISQYGAALKAAVTAGGGVAAAREADVLEILRCFAECLSVVDVFGTPAERRGIADDLVQLFELFVRNALLTPLLACARATPAIAAAAVRCVRLLAPGPRIASTPADSLLHPSQMFFKKLVISEGFVPVLLAQSVSPHAELRDEAILALAAIASRDAPARDFLLNAGAMAPLLALIDAATPLPTVRAVLAAVSALCGVTHPLTQLPPWSVVQPALERVAVVLFCDDAASIVLACRCLAILLPGCVQASYDRRLVELLQHADSGVRRAVVAAVRSVVQYDDQQMQLLLRWELVPALRGCLRSSDAALRADAVRLCGVLCGAKGQVQALIDGQVLQMLLTLMQVDEAVRFQVAKIVKYASRGTPRQVAHLVEQDVVKVACSAMQHFKVFDAVLIKAYGYGGPSFNFGFLRDLLVALENCVNVGAADADAQYASSGNLQAVAAGVNQHALKFDLEAIDKLRSVLSVIRDAGASVVASWRATDASGGSEPIELLMYRLLVKVGAAHETASGAGVGGSLSRHCYEMLQRVVAEFFTDQVAVAAATQKVLLKCVLGDDIRIVEVASSGVSFADLRAALASKYGVDGAQVLLRYVDADGDLVLIDGDDALLKAVAAHVATGAASLRLQIQLLEADEAPVGVAGAASINSATMAATNLKSPVALRRKVVPATPERAATAAAAAAASPTVTVVALDESQQLLTKPVVGESFRFELNGDGQRRDELASVVAASHFTLDEVRRLRDAWAAQTQDGTVGREAFAAGLAAIGITDPLVQEQNFSMFDRERTGRIDFRSFVVALSVLQRGTTDEKLRLLFDAYDTDGSGDLDRDETYAIVKASLVYGSARPRLASASAEHEYVTRLVADVFAAVDANNDGLLQFDEFKRAVESNAIVLESLVHVPNIVLGE
jgi:Ca2+-binding EF-hand superfamily protein